MKSIVSESGRVTIPKTVRDRLGLRPGTVLDFEARAGKLVGRKTVSEDVFKKWKVRGRLPRGGTVDDYLKQTRDARRG